MCSCAGLLQQQGTLAKLHARIRRSQLKSSSNVDHFQATLSLPEDSKLIDA